MIKEIKWDNHPILKNLELNFMKSDGAPYNTIILAGENGTGKTTILETLNTFINRGSFAPFEYIRYNIGDDIYELSKSNKAVLKYGFHNRAKNYGVPVYVNNDNIDNDVEDIRHYKVTYSRARTGFTTKPVKTTTTQQLDVGENTLYKDEDYTSIKQLFVDLINQDNAEWAGLSASHSDMTYDEFKENSRMFRFTNAFDKFFDDIRFVGSKTVNDELQVNFEKDTTVISIDQLSTGEKQIVFRGAHLLKNLKIINGGIVLVDEPELSMHPKWQEKILEYYRGLFTIDGNQTTQLIVATHSENVIRAALEDKENVLVMVLQDEEGKINAKKITHPFVLPTITSAEINYMAFKVASIDYHIELYGFLQYEIGAKTVKKCDEYIWRKLSKEEKEKFAPPPTEDKRDKERTLSTYIRNAIDHPESKRTYTTKDLEASIELLIKLYKPFSKPDESATT